DEGRRRGRGGDPGHRRAAQSGGEGAVNFSALLLLAFLPHVLSPASASAQEAKGNRYEFLVENVNGVIVSLDPEGRITFLNQYGQHFFGYSAKEILGKHMLGTLTPLAGFQHRDLAACFTEVLREPQRDD